MTIWVDAGWYGRLCREITTEDGSRAICHVWTRQNSRHKTKDGTEPWLEGEENFRLILAAPELAQVLHELYAMIEYYEGGSCHTEACQRARELLERLGMHESLQGGNDEKAKLV